MEKPKRYHPLLVSLHWIVAILVFIDLYIGLFQIRPQLQGEGFRVSDSIIKIHMAVGVTILALLIIRFIVRLVSKKPAPATAGHKLLDILAIVVHYGLYLFVLAVTVIGLIFSLQTNRFQRAFLGTQGNERGFVQGNGQPGQSSFQGNETPFPGQNGNNGRPDFGNPGQRPGNFPRGGPGGAFFLLPLHLFAAITLSLLLALHIAAAFYHQFIRKDKLLSRMWYGPR